MDTSVKHSALAELLAAASEPEPEFTIPASHASQEYSRWLRSKERLAALAPDMARVGQALAEALDGQEQVWRDANECEGCLVYVAFCESHALAFTLARSKAVDAAADWLKLGEAKEGHDG